MPSGCGDDLRAASHAPFGTSGFGLVAAPPVTSGCGGANTADSAIRRQLKPYAAKVLMKVLYAARYARPDLLRAVCWFAQYVTKWDDSCDKRLHQLMCYIHSSYHLWLTGWVGDPPDSMGPRLFADADFAGDPETSRSTSGLQLVPLV